MKHNVLLNCPFYDDFRENLFNVAKSYTVDFMSFNNEEKIMFLFSSENMIRICAKTCWQILKDIEIVYTVNCCSFLIYVHQL